MQSKNRHYNMGTVKGGFVKFAKDMKVVLEVTMTAGQVWDWAPNSEKEMAGMVEDLEGDIRKGFVQSWKYKAVAKTEQDTTAA
tara:strand:+ start:257 stop:505 length:249 start_codon:yes stop_codon:yes gene_type:complete